jgi:hypothetical protein
VREDVELIDEEEVDAEGALTPKSGGMIAPGAKVSHQISFKPGIFDKG